MKLVLSAIAVAIIATTFVGCSARSETKHISHSQTLGQELLDLQRAKDTGAISSDEYDDMKESLFKQRGG